MAKLYSYNDPCNLSLLRKACRSQFLKVSLILITLDMVFFFRSIFMGLVPSPADILSLWPLFNQGNVLVQNPLLSDVPLCFEPWTWFNNYCIQNLQIPLWNPYSSTGVPHIGNILTALFFVPSWPAVLFGLSTLTLTILYLAKLYLTGLFTYYYLRSIKLNHLSSLVGAIAFTFVGYSMVWLYYTNSSELFVLPALLYFIEKITSGEARQRDFLGLTLVTAQGIFAGHPETFFHIGFASSIYFIFKFLTVKSEIAFKILKSYSFFTFLGLMIGAIQLLPFLEYLQNSYAWTYRNPEAFFLDWNTAILNMIPEFYGSPSIYHLVPYYVNFANYNESAAGYAGISMVVLAVFAMITRYHDALTKFYLFLTIWAAGTVYGIRLIYLPTVSLPLFSHAANHRLLFLIGFCTVVLGSIAINEILNLREQGEKRSALNRLVLAAFIVLTAVLVLSYTNRGYLPAVSNLSKNVLIFQDILVLLTGLLILITCVIIYFMLTGSEKLMKFAKICIVLLIFAETGVHGMLLEPAIDAKYIHPEIEDFKNITENGDMYRTTTIGKLGSVYPANTQIMYGIYDIRNYDAIEIKSYWELLNSLSKGMIHSWVDLNEIDEDFLDFLGVKWVFSKNDLSKKKDIAVVENTDPVGELVKGFAIEQEFSSQVENLSRVDLLFATYAKEKVDSNITVLLINATTGEIIRDVFFNSKVLRDNAWYSIEMDPIKHSANKTYKLQIIGDGTPGRSVTIWRNSASKDVSGGKLYINSTPAEGSLCFETYGDLAPRYKLIKERPGYSLFENLEVIPRAFTVSEAIYKSNDSEILRALKDNSFDWRSSVLLPGDDISLEFPAGNSSTDILKYNLNYVRIRVKSTQQGILILSDAYYPGWNAYLNGTKTQLLRANYAFRAVDIPSGESIVEFKYEPLSFRLGTAMTVIALTIMIIIIIRSFNKMKK